MPHLTFSEMLRLSSWAKDAMMLSTISDRESAVSMPSFSKSTSTPWLCNSRTVWSVSTVFLAKRLMLLVMT